jgi:cystathionine beta-lyase
MTHNFDQTIDRRNTDSEKWDAYDDDVLPLWVADMDFRAPEPVIRALRERVDHGIFGYGTEPARLREVIVARLRERYRWQVAPEELIFLPGVVIGFNLACHALASRGASALVQTPVYPPMLDAPARAGLARAEMELTRGPDGRYTMDFDTFEEAIGDRARVFLLCNPHNPVGRVFDRAELERMAEICLRRGVVICSDEIHCDLLLNGHRHLPIASLAPEIADRTITLMAPSKTYNIAGLHCSVAIIQNPELRRRFQAARRGLVPHVDTLGFVAALAAYEEGGPWLDTCLRYLEANCDCLMDYVAAHLPGIALWRPEGTYLAWLDCRGAGISGNLARFFLQEARVALNDGPSFGRGGAGFVRLNFGCPRAVLKEALQRMAAALAKKHSYSSTDKVLGRG